MSNNGVGSGDSVMKKLWIGVATIILSAVVLFAGNRAMDVDRHAERLTRLERTIESELPALKALIEKEGQRRREDNAEQRTILLGILQKLKDK